MQDEDFDVLQKDLELKSDQINHLKLQIEQHKSIVNTNANLETRLRLPTTYTMSTATSTIGGTLPLFVSTPTTTNNGNQLETVVKQFHHQIEDLQRKLKHTTEICTQQESKYQKSFQDMEMKLRKAIRVRDELLQLRQSESNNQQKLINHLQQAMDTFDKNKTEYNEKITELTQNKENKEKHLTQLKERNSYLETNLQAILTVVNPGLRRLSLADFSDISVENLPKCIEKLLKENKREKEQLANDLKVRDNKIEDLQRDWVQKLDMEKEMIASKTNGIEKQHQIDTEAKQKDIEKLELKISKLQENMKAKDEFYEKELSKKNEEINTTLENYLTQTEKLRSEKEKIQEKCTSLEGQVIDLNQEKEKLYKEYTELTANMSNVTMEVNTAKEHVKILESKNSQLQSDVNELQSTLHSIRNTSDVERVRLDSEIKHKCEQNVEMIQREKDLKEQLIRITQDVTKTIREEEILKHKGELKEINNTIESYKEVLQKTKVEINEKNSLITKLENNLYTRNNTIRSYETEIENSRQQLKYLNKIVGEKDSTLVSTVLQVDKLTKKNQICLQQIKELESVIQQQNQSFEKQCEKIKLLEKDKMELLQNIDKCNFQSDFVKNEWDNIKNGLNDKNNEINLMQKEKKILAKKLKEKHNNLVLCEQEINKIATENHKVQESYSKLEKNFNRVSRKCSELQTTLETIKNEKNMLQEIVEEREEVKEKEVINLLQKLKISESDLQLLTEMLKNQKLSDAKALKLACTNQRVVTKQRADIDHLKTKIQWLKEALDVSESTREELNKEMLTKEKVLQKIKLKLKVNIEENESLKMSLVETQDESRRLHNALEMTAMKYADVYSLVEKQEQFMMKERQVMEQKMSNIQVFQHQPQQVKPVENINKALNGTTEDLRSLLKDVKVLLSSTVAEKKKSVAIIQTSDKTTETVSTENETVIPIKKVQNLTANKTEYISNSVTPMVGKHSLLLDEYLRQYSNETVSVLSNSEVSNITPTNNFMMTSSPKELLASTFASDVSNHSVYSIGTLQLSEIENKSMKSDKIERNEPMQRIQNKLTALKDMGEVLTNNNKELSNMMKKRSKRLRKLTPVNAS